MSEAEALLLERSLRFSPQESALEQGWLLAEMEQRFGYSLEELARRFDRSASWVSRRSGAGRVTAGSDPAASARRQDRSATGDEVSGADGASQRGDCERMAAALVKHSCDTRQAGATLYGLARRLPRGARAHSRRTGTVFENATADAGQPGLAVGNGPGARSGDGGGHPAARQPAAGRSPAGDGPPATGTNATADRKRAPGTGPDGGAHRKGTGSRPC